MKIIGEHEPAINDHHAVPCFHDHAVLADCAQAAQGSQPDIIII